MQSASGLLHYYFLLILFFYCLQVEMASISTQAKRESKQFGGYMLYTEDELGYKRYLMLKPKGRRTWIPPNGPAKPGEDEYEAARRNLKEKTGIKKEDVKEIPLFDKVVRSRIGDTLTKTTYLIGELANSNISIHLPNDYTQYKWMYIKDMDNFQVSKLNTDALTETDWFIQ